jgi:hypothetical protein
MSAADIAALKKSPLFTRKRKEAEELFNSPEYKKHALKRVAIRKKRTSKVGMVTGAVKIVVAIKSTKSSRGHRTRQVA